MARKKINNFKNQIANKNKNYSLKFCLFLALAAIHFIFLFDSEGLYKWAEQIKDPNLQSFFLPSLQKWHQATELLDFTVPRSFLREKIFLPLYNMKFVLTEEPATSSNSLPQFNPIEVIYSVENPLDVLIIGDSFAGLSFPPAFYQACRNNPYLRATVKYKISSSLSNPSFFNWAYELKNICEVQRQKYKKNFDLIIVLLGSNDAQSVQIENKIYLFDTPEWLEYFKQRAIEFFEVLSANSYRIYWIGVPPMQKAGYRERMQRINTIYQEVIKNYPQIQFLSLDFILGDEKGNYIPAKIVDNVYQIIRETDGIHFSQAGAKLVVQEIIKKLKADFKFRTE